MSALLLQFWPYLLGAGAVALAAAKMYFFGRDTANAKRDAQEAKARAENLKDVKRAQDAAAAVRADDGGMLDDPRNRDNRR